MAPLDVLLTQVPYVNRPRVKTDIDTLLRSTSKCSLLPKIGLYGNDCRLASMSSNIIAIVIVVHVNGTESRVVILGGTIPIYFGGAQVCFVCFPEFTLFKTYLFRSIIYQSIFMFLSAILMNRRSCMSDQLQVSFTFALIRFTQIYFVYD